MDKVLVDIGSKEQIFNKMVSEVQMSIDKNIVSIILFIIALGLVICCLCTCFSDIISHWETVSFSDKIILFLLVLLIIFIFAAIMINIYFISESCSLLNEYNVNSDMAVADYIERYSYD